MNTAIDDAAVEAGRGPAEIRRMYNVTGHFGNGRGFLRGSPANWAEQLAGLSLTDGISTYILSVSSESEVRRFADEVIPAVRELVEAERGRDDAGGAAGT